MQDNFEPIEIPSTSTKIRRITLTVIIVLLVVILAVVAALLVKHYVISTFIVDGISMYPTLDGGNGAIAEGDSDAERVNGEVLYLNKLAKIKRGDIVVFTPKNWNLGAGERTSLVKRVIGVAGDRIQIIDGQLYLNEKLMDEPYINEPMNDRYDGLDEYVTEGHIFCMGDNRNNSSDSRAFGLVSLDEVEGKCFLIKSINGKLRWC